MNVLEKIQKIREPYLFQWKKKMIKIDKDGNKSVIKMKFIDSLRFMATSLSNLVHNLTEGIHKMKCKDCDCFHEYESVKDN